MIGSAKYITMRPRATRHIRRFVLIVLLLAFGAYDSAEVRSKSRPPPSSAPGSQAQIAGNAYYVSVHGNDRNDGSLAKPFATLSRAASAMRRSGIKTSYIDDGIYNLAAPLILKTDDSGATIQAYSDRRPILCGKSAHLTSIVIIDGATNVNLIGLGFSNAASGPALLLSRSSGNRIVGNFFSNNRSGIVLTGGSSNNIVSNNQIDGSWQVGIEVKDGSNFNRFENNVVNRTRAVGTEGGGFHLHGVQSNVISHNLVKNTAGMGIGIENWDISTINLGNVVEYNLVENANTDVRSVDSGSIYVLGRSQFDTKMTIQGNIIRGTGRPDPAHTVGIYLDDLTSGVIVRDNILSGIGSDAVQIHGGRNNTVTNNIIDTGPGHASAVLFQAAPLDTHATIAMTNNVVSSNIIYSSSAEPTIFVYYDGGSPTIGGNLYYNAAGATMATHPPVEDARPLVANPEFADPTKNDYTIAPGSPALRIGFKADRRRRIGPSQEPGTGP